MRERFSGPSGTRCAGWVCPSRRPFIPFVRNTSPDERVRHSDGARAVRPPQRENDDDLHTCPESRRPRGPEPSRSALTEKRFPLSGPRRMPRRGTEAFFLPRDTGQRQASIWQKARQIACQNPSCGNAYVSQGLAEALQVSAVKGLRFLGPKPILDRRRMKGEPRADCSASQLTPCTVGLRLTKYMCSANLAREIRVRRHAPSYAYREGRGTSSFLARQRSVGTEPLD